MPAATIILNEMCCVASAIVNFCVQYVFKIEESILDSEAWQVGSPLWEVIKENGCVIPQVEEVGSQVEAIVFFVKHLCCEMQICITEVNYIVLFIRCACPIS